MLARASKMKACPQCHIRYPQEAVYCFLDGAELAVMHDPLIGTTIAGRYLVEDVLGEGGMATVYRARHKLVDRPCAIKVMNATLAMDPTVRERFRREAKSAQALAHPNVIEIFDQGETTDGTPYIVMEMLAGSELAHLLQSGAMQPPRAVPIMIQLARGIARAHDLGVVHRDLKPENIFVCPRPEGPDLVKILDFGIARSRGDTRLTGAGELFGTPQYLAPERIMAGEAGPSVDLYALGVIFFEMSTGKLPFEASDAATFLVKHMKEKPPTPRSLDRRVPERLDALIVQLLEKDPRARPVDAHRIENDLVALAQSLEIEVPPEPEDDPASSQQPARTLPPAMVEQWVKRVEVFEQMLDRSYGAAPPSEQGRTLGELKKHMGEIGDLRASSAKEQRALEEIDARGRDGRQRFGFAVDALGVDASKAKVEVRAARAELELLAVASKQAGAAYAEAQREVVTWEGRSGLAEPHAQLAKAYSSCADKVESWLVVRKRELAAQRALEEKERAASDLEYQIAELRTALAHHERGNESARDAAQNRLVELSGRAEEIETRLLQLATRFCEPLRARPELGPFFQQLESEAAATG